MNANAIRTGNKFGLTVDEAAAYTGIGRNTLRMLIKQGKLPALFIGRKNVIRTDVLEQFLAANQGINLLDMEQVKNI
ncbi:MAG: helix-turn-helix domain-containing protein [Phocaeicola sp.]